MARSRGLRLRVRLYGPYGYPYYYGNPYYGQTNPNPPPAATGNLSVTDWSLLGWANSWGFNGNANGTVDGTSFALVGYAARPRRRQGQRRDHRLGDLDPRRGLELPLPRRRHRRDTGTAFSAVGAASNSISKDDGAGNMTGSAKSLIGAAFNNESAGYFNGNMTGTAWSLAGYASNSVGRAGGTGNTSGNAWTIAGYASNSVDAGSTTGDITGTAWSLLGVASNSVTRGYIGYGGYGG